MASFKEGPPASSRQMRVQGPPPAPLDQAPVYGRVADWWICPECGLPEGHTWECPEKVPLELCTGDTADCPHYACPDGWHQGDAPNCSCTPDCALGEDDEDRWFSPSRMETDIPGGWLALICLIAAGFVLAVVLYLVLVWAMSL